MSEDGRVDDGDGGGGRRHQVASPMIDASLGKGSAASMANKMGSGLGNDSREKQSSYKEKLLSLGDSGFLEMNLSATEALSGWKNYLSKMEEKKGVEEGKREKSEEQEVEEVQPWWETGKLPKLTMTSDEYASWCKPYMNSLIVKLLGKTLI